MARAALSPFLRNLHPFAAPEHLPFHWEGGEPAALLVHGFPGTPADVRPLGASLHAAGWTVKGPLLPGFGPELATLPERRYHEWVGVVTRELASLKARHSPVLLVAHSMGGALALMAGLQEQVQAQVLLAPYWRFGHMVTHHLWPLLRPAARYWRPMKRADFDDPRVRTSLLRILPDVDLDDPLARDELRRFVIPVRLLDEVRRLGMSAFAAARHAKATTLVVQGTRDRLVRARDTTKLALRLPNRPLIELVDGSHNVTRPDDGAWDRVESAVLRFAASLCEQRAPSVSVYAGSGGASGAP